MRVVARTEKRIRKAPGIIYDTQKRNYDRDERDYTDSINESNKFGQTA